MPATGPTRLNLESSQRPVRVRLDVIVASGSLLGLEVFLTTYKYKYKSAYV